LTPRDEAPSQFFGDGAFASDSRYSFFLDGCAVGWHCWNMNTKLVLLAALLFALPGFAQPVFSPEVHADRSVTFRLAAPKAKEVQLHCEGVKDSTLQKDANGVWTFTTEPLEPDIYVYSFRQSVSKIQSAEHRQPGRGARIASIAVGNQCRAARPVAPPFLFLRRGW
jgi:hypothetical protein